MRKVETLPTRDREAGYGPALKVAFADVKVKQMLEW